MKDFNETAVQPIREHDAEEFAGFANAMNTLYCTEAYSDIHTPECKKLFLTYDRLRSYGCTPEELKLIIEEFTTCHEEEFWQPAHFIKIFKHNRNWRIPNKR